MDNGHTMSIFGTNNPSEDWSNGTNSAYGNYSKASVSVCLFEAQNILEANPNNLKLFPHEIFQAVSVRSSAICLTTEASHHTASNREPLIII